MSKFKCDMCSKSFHRRSWNQVRCNACYWLANTLKGRAHRDVYKAIARGELADLRVHNVGCVDCAERATVYDHRDYAKPTCVDPVCHRCNLKRGPGASLKELAA